MIKNENYGSKFASSQLLDRPLFHGFGCFISSILMRVLTAKGEETSGTLIKFALTCSAMAGSFSGSKI